jgi:hypothetical protein
MRKVMLAGFLAFAYVLPESAGAAELKQETTGAFNQYVRITEDRMTEGMRDVLRSRLLKADGNYFKVYLRLHQNAIIIAVFNAEFDVSYFPLDKNRAHSRSYSTRIAELENPDRSDEREKPVGNDRGFLWRLYSYWRFQEKDRGVYVQLESVALSRSVPVLLAWVVNPLLKSIPREYLSRLLISTRVALTNTSAAASFDASPSMKRLSAQFFLVAPPFAAVQNEGHSTVILPIQERTICAPQKS